MSPTGRDVPHITRRQFMHVAAAGVVAPALVPSFGDTGKERTILLRAGWQLENIGDIAHGIGCLGLLEQHLPDAHVIYWPVSLDDGVRRIVRDNFPKVELVRGRLGTGARPADAELADAWNRADLLLHGSGPSVIAHKVLDAWHESTGKPYGVYGTTIGHVMKELKPVLDNAAFVYTRETESLRVIERAGVTSRVMGFAPDSTFGIQVRDDRRAEKYLAEHGLEAGKFMCTVPRLRYTPYHRFKKARWSREKIDKVESTNAKTKEKDHAKLRDVIIRWVRETGHKVLACPEMTYQLDIIRPLLIDPLPDDVKRHVVPRQHYWYPDEAGSVYRRARLVVSAECHSPIIAFAHGTPAFYVRQPTDTIKGHMYHDIGASDWIFEIDAVTGRDIADRVLRVHHHYDAARDDLAQVMAHVRKLQKETMQTVAAAM